MNLALALSARVGAGLFPVAHAAQLLLHVQARKAQKGTAYFCVCVCVCVCV